jgi:hypothetical protein
MIPITLSQLDCGDLNGGHNIQHIQNQNIYTHQLHQPIQQQQQTQTQQIQQQQQQQQSQRRDFYTDNHTQLIGTDQNLLQNLDLTTSQALNSNSCNFGDYVIKYESTGNHHAHDNLNELDDEDEDDEMDEEDDDCDNSFLYDTSDAGSNMELKNTNASLLDGYSVFDSPLSLYTSSDEFNNALLNSLNNTSTRDFNGLYSLSNAQQQLQKQAQQQVNTSGSLSSNQHDVSTSNTSSSTSSSANSQQSQQLNGKDEHIQLKNSKNEGSSKNDNQSNIPMLNDYELISLPLRELNKRLRFVPKTAAIDLKKRRRTLKNRKYAQNCRSKRLEQKSEMEIQNIKLKAELSRLQKILEKTTKEKYLYKAYITELIKDPSKINSLQLEWNEIAKE